VRGAWLVKSEPGTYSWQDLVREGGTRWDGVRNPSARNSLAAMRRGDLVLVYHSGDEKAVVGIARVRREAYPDPTASDPRWLAVDLEPVRALARAVPLASVKAEAALRGIALVRQPRLSVMPLAESAFRRILELGGARRPRR
jgi:predicted RNA-binding protein with PUA-like domain